jgi:hypothetical protein
MIRCSRLLAAAVLVIATPALAHVLGGGGRPSGTSSGGGSSGNAWNQLDPATPAPDAGSPEQQALAAQLKKMKSYCDSVDPAARESCYGALNMSAAAVDSMKKSLDAQNAASAVGGNATPRTKLDHERNDEAERLKSERARCDALEGADADGCYEEMRATHEAWHERYEPMHLPELPDFKKQRLARAKCMKIKDVKKRHQCLMDLVKKKTPKIRAEPGASEGK